MKRADHNTASSGKRKYDNSNTDEDLKFEEIDIETYRASFNLISSSPLLRSVVTYFSNSCISNEVSVFSKDGSEIAVSADLRDVVASYFIPVVLRAIRWILVTGVVPVSFENITADLCVPVIPDPEDVTLSCARITPGFRTIYRVIENGSDNIPNGPNASAPVEKLFPCNLATMTPGGNGGGSRAHGGDAAVGEGAAAPASLFVISDFSIAPPTSTGKLQSPFQTVLNVMGDLNLLKAQRQQALQYLINPPIVTKVSDDRRDEADRGLSFEVVGGTNVLYNAQAAAVEHAKLYAREHPEALLGMSDGQRGDHGELTDFVNAALQNSTESRATCITLPTNHELVKQHLPILPPDYLATMKMYEEKVCAVFGLPLGVVMGYVGSHRTSSVKTGGSTATAASSNAASNAAEMHIAQVAVSRMRLDLELFLTRILKVACYKNHYRKPTKGSKRCKRETESDDMDADDAVLMANYAGAECAEGCGSSDENIKELGLHDLLPAGAYCKLRSMELVTRLEENAMINEEILEDHRQLEEIDIEVNRNGSGNGDRNAKEDEKGDNNNNKAKANAKEI